MCVGVAVSQHGEAVRVDLRAQDGQVDRQAVEGDRTAPDAVAQADQQAAKAPRRRDPSKPCECCLRDDELAASSTRG
eukprot:3020368-Heterocapsa_arctica.AAC.1